MSTRDNQSQPKNKDFYDGAWHLTINNHVIEVTEEVYRAYKQPLWAERKRKEREKRCMISDGKGKTKRCTDDCSKCDKQRSGTILSLDGLAEESCFEPADSVDIAELVAGKLLLEELFAALDELDPDNRRIMALFANGKSEREIAADIGLSQKAINKRKAKLFEQLRNRLKDFI